MKRLFDDVHQVDDTHTVENLSAWLSHHTDGLVSIPEAEAFDNVINFVNQESNKLEPYLEPHSVSKKQKMVDGRYVSRRPIPMDTTPPTHGGPNKATRMNFSRYHNTLGTVYKRRCKRAVKEAQESTGNTFDKDLVVTNCVNIGYTDQDSTENKRNGFQCYVKGVRLKCCFRIRKDQTVLTDPLTIRWAILVPETNTGSISDINAIDFFKNRESLGDEFYNFPASGNYLEYHGRQINTSKYGVMQSGTFTLSPSSTGSDAYRHWDQIKLMNIWVPLKRVFQWDNITTNPGDDEPTSNVHFVFWYTERGDLGVLPQFTVANTGPLAWNIEKTTFFKNFHV